MSADATCPTCGKVLANRHGMRIHHVRAHDESLVEDELATCDHCDEEYIVPAGATGQYCSVECRDDAMREGERVACEQCGEEFHAADWELKRGQGRFCSHDCYGASLEDRDEDECAGCGRDYSAYSSANIRYCSRACMAEAQTSAPRPDDRDGLLWVLYVYEDHTARDTWLRVNNHTDEWLTKDAVTERLKDNDWMQDAGYNGSSTARKLEQLEPSDIGLDDEPDSPDETWQKYYQEQETEASDA